MNNPELPESAASIDATLKDIASEGSTALETLQLIDDGLGDIHDELRALRQSAFPPPKPRATPTPPPNPSWPWSYATDNQGFLSGRWERRDGNVYAGGAGRTSAPNSPVIGGESVDATVAVSSGVPRSG